MITPIGNENDVTNVVLTDAAISDGAEVAMWKAKTIKRCRANDTVFWRIVSFAVVALLSFGFLGFFSIPQVWQATGPEDHRALIFYFAWVLVGLGLTALFFFVTRPIDNSFDGIFLVYCLLPALLGVVGFLLGEFLFMGMPFGLLRTFFGSLLMQLFCVPVPALLFTLATTFLLERRNGNMYDSVFQDH